METIAAIQEKWNWALIYQSCRDLLADPSVSVHLAEAGKLTCRKLVAFALLDTPGPIYTIVDDLVLQRTGLGEKIEIVKTAPGETYSYVYAP